MAVKTSHPSLASRVSAVRRIVLLSSMTSTLRPWSFELVPDTETTPSTLGSQWAPARFAGRSGFNISANPLLWQTPHDSAHLCASSVYRLHVLRLNSRSLGRAKLAT